MACRARLGSPTPAITAHDCAIASIRHSSLAAEPIGPLAIIPGDTPRPRCITRDIGTEHEAVQRLLELGLRVTDDRTAFQAEGDLVWIITAKRKYLATQTLKVIQSRLGGATFQRIHRNALVNVDHVRKMSPLSSQRWLITLSNGQEFITSKRQARSIRQLLQLVKS